ncbi:MAG: hypothetical protein U9Q62_05320 [Campylobacterota bacterium]|nr:hypothetical protein [Campylobacterota bacterium]
MAGVGPVASTIFTNQMTAAVASEKNAVHNRFELQNVAANAITNEKQKEVEEVRPAEENHMVDPDREHTKEESEQEMKRGKKEEEEKKGEGEDEETPPIHHLDIKV